jgi:NIMA (never in mitosis gene a)-related kinase
LYDFSVITLIVLDDDKGVIGKGSYGKVHLVIRKDDRKLFALKRISLKVETKDIDFAKKYKNHNFPHVVGIYDSFYDGDDFCVVMELCKNGSLTDFINYHVDKKVFHEEPVFLFK